MTDAKPDTDTEARKRIQAVTEAVMQKAADSLSAMANQIITNIREDETFLGAVLTPGVDLNLDLQVPDALEHKIMVLVAECVALDRVETLYSALEAIWAIDLDCIACGETLERLHDEAHAEAADIIKAADQVRATKPPAPADEVKQPGIVIPEGLVKCKKCGGVAKPLSKCPRCGQDVGLKL